MATREPDFKRHDQCVRHRPWLQQSRTWRGCADPKSFERDYPLCAEAERLQLEAGALAYHHFIGDERLASQRSIFEQICRDHYLIGKPRFQSVEEITEALQDSTSDAPHYGDGVYGTVHKDIRLACAAVKRAHGMTHDRTHRVVLAIRQTSPFRKYPWTGGVTRYLGEDRAYTDGDNIYLFDGHDVEFVRVEVWKDGGWHELPWPLLGA